MSQLQVTGEAKIRDLQGPVVANSGVITALDGAASQYVRGDGTLADFPTATGGGSSVSYYLNGSVNQGTFGGSTYYQMSKNAITGTGTNFSTSANGLLAQFITDANDPDQTSIPSGNWNIEFFMNVSASSGSLASFYVEFYKYDGSTFTLLATNVATPEFLTGTTTIDAYYTSVAFPETPLATTDRLAIRIYANVASKTVTLYTEDNRLCQVVTTFSRGILSLNNLTDQQQYFAVGTSGSDFNIVSSLDTHTFNIPTASATKRGLLSSTDWSTFNNKQPAGNYVTLDTTQTITGEKTFSGDTTSITSSYFNLDGITGSTGNALNIKQYATNLVTGVGYSSIGAIDTTKFSFYLGNTSAFDSRIFVLDASNLTINTTKTYTLPNITGTLALLEGNQTFLGDKTFDGISNFNTTIFNSLQNNFNYGFQVAKQNTLATQAGYMTISSVAGTASTLKISDGNSSTNTIFTFDTTGSRAYTFPALTGTIALLEGSQTFSGSKSFTAFVSFSGPTTKLGNGLYFDKGGLPSALTTTTTNLYSDSGNNNIVSQDNNNKSKLQFQGSSDYTYTFPASSGTIALTSDLSSYVTLSTTQTISGSKTFSSIPIIDNGGTGMPLRFKAYASGGLGLSGYTDIAPVGTTAIGFAFGISSSATKLAYFSAAGLTDNTARTYTLPDATGTLALTSNIPSVSGTSGQVTYFNGTSSVTGSSNHFWDATNNRLGIGLTNPQRSLEIYSATADSHLRLSGNAPSVSMGEAITGSVYQAKFGLATAAGQYVSGAVAGDFVMLSQTGATIFATSATEKARITSGGNLLVGTTSDNGAKLQVSGAATFSSSVTANGAINARAGGYLALYDISTNTNRWDIYTNSDNSYRMNYNGAGNDEFVITSAGNVGIGTSSPSSLLHVNTASAAANMLILSNGTLQLNIGLNNSQGSFINEATANALRFGTQDTERMRITSGGGVGIGATSVTGTYKLRVINSSAVQGDPIFASDNNVYNSILVYAAGADGYNGAATVMIMGRNTSTGRSLNAGGTINAMGLDYAEYMTKAIEEDILKGDIVGVDENGLLTNIFLNAKSFVVKSTNPSYVGGDSWGSVDNIGKLKEEPTDEEIAEHESKLQAARVNVDRIAFSGQVPCNVYNANVGDYIIPIEVDGKISGQAVSNPTFEQYQISVGKVWKIMEDGRAWIAVKIG